MLIWRLRFAAPPATFQKFGPQSGPYGQETNDVECDCE